MWSSSQHFSNSYEWGSSWRTPTKARLCRTWPRLITSPLSPGSDELFLLLLKAPSRELWKHFFLFTSLLSSIGSPRDVTADCRPRVAWETADHLTQEKHIDVMKTLLVVDITRIIGKTYQRMNFVLPFLISFFFFCLIVIFATHTLHPVLLPPTQAHTHPIHFLSQVSIETKCRPLWALQ